MKLNQDKCHLLMSGDKYDTILAKIGETKIWESKQNIPGIIIDGNLSFLMHAFLICMRKLARNYQF